MKTDEILTKREARVVRLYAEGYIGKEIADIMNISYYTVVNFTQNIYEKTGIKRSTNALVSWWFCTNFSIDLTEAQRKAGATILLLIFCTQILSFDETALRRARRGRRTETECIWEE